MGSCELLSALASSISHTTPSCFAFQPRVVVPMPVTVKICWRHHVMQGMQPRLARTTSLLACAAPPP